jgi:hypothetical protein
MGRQKLMDIRFAMDPKKRRLIESETYWLAIAKDKLYHVYMSGGVWYTDLYNLKGRKPKLIETRLSYTTKQDDPKNYIKLSSGAGIGILNVGE